MFTDWKYRRKGVKKRQKCFYRVGDIYHITKGYRTKLVALTGTPRRYYFPAVCVFPDMEKIRILRLEGDLQIPLDNVKTRQEFEAVLTVLLRLHNNPGDKHESI